MSDISPTAATVIAFAEKLEEQTAACYGALVTRFPEQAGQFERFAKRAARTQMEVVRTYRETVSDALETNFAFGDVDLNTFRGCWDAPEGDDLVTVVASLLQMERLAEAFYSEMAERSESLLATIPSAFRRAAKVRAQRMTRLKRMTS
jgi:hypothetical protein